MSPMVMRRRTVAGEERGLAARRRSRLITIAALISPGSHRRRPPSTDVRDAAAASAVGVLGLAALDPGLELTMEREAPLATSLGHHVELRQHRGGCHARWVPAPPTIGFTDQAHGGLSRACSNCRHDEQTSCVPRAHPVGGTAAERARARGRQARTGGRPGRAALGGARDLGLPAARSGRGAPHCAPG